MSTTIPTSGQLERNLSQRIQAFYRNEVGHQPSKITCTIFPDKLVVVMENSITNAEDFLYKKGQEDLALQIRSSLDEAIEPQLKALIEETLNVGVTDFLSDATLETGRSGIIALLSEAPLVRTKSFRNKNE